MKKEAVSSRDGGKGRWWGSGGQGRRKGRGRGFTKELTLN
jgi:hypothetical protein